MEEVLEGLADKEKLRQLVYEFDANETPEAQFVHFCDKLEADLQCKIYDEEHCVDFKDQSNNILYNDPEGREYFQGDAWSDTWLKVNQKKYNYDENFVDISEYARQNKITR